MITYQNFLKDTKAKGSQSLMGNSEFFLLEKKIEKGTIWSSISGS